MSARDKFPRLFLVDCPCRLSLSIVFVDCPCRLSLSIVPVDCPCRLSLSIVFVDCPCRLSLLIVPVLHQPLQPPVIAVLVMSDVVFSELSLSLLDGDRCRVLSF